MSERGRVISCEAVRRLIGMPGLPCCSSCHNEEEDDIYPWMHWYDFGKNREADICCDVKNELDKWLNRRADGKGE